MNSKLERRFLQQQFDIDSTGDSPKIRGYAAVFNSASADLGYTEYVDPHAFDNTLNADVRALFNHNPDCVLGRSSAGTLKLSIDTKGLAYEIDPPDTQLGRDLMTSMKRGDIRESSFGFYCLEDDWKYDDDGNATRTLLKVELTDVSPVTYPAYPATQSEARCFPDGMPEEVRAHLEPPAPEPKPQETTSNDAEENRNLQLRIEIAQRF